MQLNIDSKLALSTIKVANIASSELDGLINGACLDAPRENVLVEPAQVFEFRGWVLPADETISISLEIVADDIAESHSLNVMRPDVLKHYENKYQIILGRTLLKCGFRFDFKISTRAELYLVINDKRFLWQELTLDRPDLGKNLLLQTWENYSSNNITKIKHGDGLSVAQSSVKIIDELIVNKITMLNSEANKIKSSGHFSEEEFDHLKKFLIVLKQPDFSVNVIEQATTKNFVELPHPTKDCLAKASESFHLNNNISYLRFAGEKVEPFFMVQLVSTADAIFFPSRSILLVLQHINLAHLQKLIVYIIKNMNKVVSYSLGKNKFSGIIASHTRPYHFYYDVAPGIEALYKANVLKQVPQLTMSVGSDFFSFKKLYNLECEEKTSDFLELTKSNFQDKTFHIQAGIFFGRSDEKIIREFDERLVESVKENTKNSPERFQGTDKTYPLIWYGITGQKRSWVEQIEFATYFFNQISNAFPSVGVVFDGWTSPINPTPADIAETKRDEMVVEKIKAQLPDNIHVYSVVGKTTLEKVEVALAVDFFISNYSTGSMHVARFAKKPGVGHLNTKMIRTQHIHHHTIEVPIGDVIDIPDPDPSHSTTDYISYSISQSAMMNTVKKMISSQNLFLNRWQGIS